VDDASTKALFEAFYAAQARPGVSPAEALREAMAVVREQPGWWHPYYWAAFQASGLAFRAPVHPDDEIAIRNNGDSTGLSATIEAITANGIRGGTMEADDLVRMAEAWLADQLGPDQQLLDSIVHELGPDGASVLRDRLQKIQRELGGVTDNAELLSAVNAIHELVESTPALARELLEDPESSADRSSLRAHVTPIGFAGAMGTDTHPQERAARLENAVVVVREAMEAAIKRLEARHDDRNRQVP
jgi:hypothetical protein